MSYSNTHKRTASTAVSDSLSSPSSSSAARHFTSMKKAKSQASASSMDSKNGLQHHQTSFTSPPDADDESSSMIVDDSLKTHGVVSPGGTSRAPINGGVTANLSRKKATPPNPTKKALVIKLHKGKPTLPDNYEEDTWARLRSAITGIFLKQRDSCELEKLYKAVDGLCTMKLGRNLYQRIEKECEEHISTAIQSLVGRSPDLAVFLSLVENCWQDLCDQMKLIRSIALVLDRKYVKHTPNVRSLWDMGLHLFRKHLSLCPEVEHKIVSGLLRLIERERSYLRKQGIRISGTKAECLMRIHEHWRMITCPAAEMVDGSKVLYYEQEFWRTPQKPFKQEAFEHFLSECPWEEDLMHANVVCDQVGVPLEVVHLTDEYWEKVF